MVPCTTLSEVGEHGVSHTVRTRESGRRGRGSSEHRAQRTERGLSGSVCTCIIAPPSGRALPDFMSRLFPVGHTSPLAAPCACPSLAHEHSVSLLPKAILSTSLPSTRTRPGHQRRAACLGLVLAELFKEGVDIRFDDSAASSETDPMNQRVSLRGVRACARARHGRARRQRAADPAHRACARVKSTRDAQF